LVTPTPCCPGWTVRDVLSHVAGIPDDAFAGRMDGVASEAWTAAQVERNRDLSVDQLLARWDEQAEPFAAGMTSRESRPPFDCHTHEHDVRQAVNRPGNRESRLVAIAAAGLAEPLREADVSCDLSDFELFRSRLGRRSRAQVEAYPWSGDAPAVAEVIDAWFVFGPSAVDIAE
jgi:uncharacterized protein (TIGR03083 family)